MLKTLPAKACSPFPAIDFRDVHDPGGENEIGAKDHEHHGGKLELPVRSGDSLSREEQRGELAAESGKLPLCL